MTTARDWIDRALRANGVLAQGESLNADDAAVALDRLNMMLGSWSLQRGTINTETSGTFNMVPGQAAYSSSLLSERPAGITAMRATLSSIDYPINHLVSASTYNAIPYKATPGVPSMCWVNNGAPDMTFTFYPTPHAAFVCTVVGWSPLLGTLTLNSTVVVPPGYDLAIVDNLAVACCSSFGRSVSEQLGQSARTALAWVKRSNYVPRDMETGLPREGRYRRYDINGDQ